MVQVRKHFEGSIYEYFFFLADVASVIPWGYSLVVNVCVCGRVLVCIT